MTASTSTDEIVQVRMHVDSSVSAVWHALTSPDGSAVWLGPGAVLGDKGQSYHCEDGSYGMVRSFHPLEQLRLTWHASSTAPASMIEVDVTPEPAGMRLRLWHEGLSHEEQEEMRSLWSLRVDALVALLAEREAAEAGE